jgi:hypothetical protein
MRKLITIGLLTISVGAHCAMNGLSIHSRNNCGNNESISWDAWETWHLGTNSYHYTTKNQMHPMGSGIQYTWRSAAVCWGEGVGGYARTAGEHYLFQNGSTKLIWLKTTDVKDCSIYDGWWEWKGP